MPHAKDSDSLAKLEAEAARLERECADLDGQYARALTIANRIAKLAREARDSLDATRAKADRARLLARADKAQSILDGDS